MNFHILTLFPDLITTICGTSIIGRAQEAGHLAVTAHNIRDYTADKHRRVDDTPYGGGEGMLLSVQPIYDCHRAIIDSINQSSQRRGRHTIYMSPTGKVLTQQRATELSQMDNLVILCGHYEGVDRRAVELICDEEISVGDYVLTGGELPACLLIDCVARLLPGVLASEAGHQVESIASGMLEYPQYTRPAEFMSLSVPQVLLEGNHADIEKWRYRAALELTKRNRPDLV
ncbi:MAG: tRNA (guanosine(37)-N1)-methyltransferase TrmD [Oscillospiraceae bacterium]|nr:tRNA (guanosine(37)-N1)-methyltransferase TrmD [Oscillospiraceae bacterium]